MIISKPFDPPPIVLAFSASDPTGGAGMQADILTLASIGCHPLSVITAITVQDTAGVKAVLPTDADWVADQARTLLEDIRVSAFKLGMLGSVENIIVIAEILSDYPDIPLVFDPVLASGRGDELANEDMLDAIVELLFPQTMLITPNSLEARRLILHMEVSSDDSLDLAQCAQHLIGNGCEYALITGTHENTSQVANNLYGNHGLIRSDEWVRLPGSYHGSGCTLASAVAGNLAFGQDISEAVGNAQDFVWQTLSSGFRPGMGQYLPNRFFRTREDGHFSSP